ncbi:outer membrane usher protein [Pseudomonas sp. JAI115]|uniref:fimbria/pilus outer membrane usher protein n=1 Tax=Pseudomonas sp. JAI115 TaxID=2723061 RepID=UPI00161ECDB8|nr:fimbria/pilus outer membrane usher protein [Pseudomonas sp. JAI115]MBB6155235.1 outer membrane usher protein [Pseudomonas sp. JAI115]
MDERHHERVASNSARPSVLVALWTIALVALSLFYPKAHAAVDAPATPATPATPASPDSSDEYQFDENLMFGMGSVARFNKPNAIEPGDYSVELYINNHFVQRATLRFSALADGRVQPCLTAALLENAGVKRSAIEGAGGEACLELVKAVKGASFTFDMGAQRLDLQVPQSLINRMPQGYVPPESLDSGETLGFVNYNLNHYHVSHTGSYASRSDSSYGVFNSGVNMGMWRLRQQGSVRYSDQGAEWNSTLLYLQRPLPSLQSELTLGEGYTSGQFFSGVSYRGLELASDERMLPESIRGYAPTVRGIAQSNARVSIVQDGSEIYQTVVPAGPFEISDLYATHYNGDLQVTVEEADGRISRFSVPFSSVAESLRPGSSRYAFALARTRDMGTDTAFTELTYQHGLSNAVTVNSGLRLAQDYQAVLLGGVYANWLGAFGLDTTYARSDVQRAGQMSGWMSRLSYSRTFEPTQTLLTVAGYRYFSAGYRDFGDVLNSSLTYNTYNGYAGTDNQYLPNTRWEVSVNQALDVWGSLYLSAATQNYRGGHDRDTQYQMGYSQVFNDTLRLNVSVARQRTGPSRSGYAGGDPGVIDDPLVDSSFNQVQVPGITETLVLVSLSFPLGDPSHVNTPVLNSSVSHSVNYGDVYQSSLSGVAGEEQSLSYGLDVSHDAEQRQNTYSGNVQKRTRLGTLGLNASKGQDYWQAAGSARGGVAIHRGGITLGPYLGDTFALVQAKGATGAGVLNGQGTHIDSSGYALVPSLTPYRYNTIALDPEGMDVNTELESGQQRVAPLAGAAVKIEFKTRSGAALLITAHLPQGQVIPMGAEVMDDQGVVVGMVGQGSQAYVRSEQQAGHFSIRWGEEADEQCVMAYDLKGLNLKQPLVRLDSECRTAGSAP